MAHKTASGNQSEAWKTLENRVAELLRRAGFRRAARVLKETHDSAPDVDVPEIPDLAIDTKYSSRGFPQHAQFLSEVETYVGARRRNEDRRYGWAIMPIRPKDSPDILVVLRLEKFLELLQHVFLRKKTGDWGCMRCGNEVEETGSFAGQYQYKCKTCGMCVMTDETPDPKHKGRVASQREKLRAASEKSERSVIKGPPVDTFMGVTVGDKNLTEITEEATAAINAKDGVVIATTSGPVITLSAKTVDEPFNSIVPTGHKPLPGQLSAQDLIARMKSPPPSTTKRPKKSRKEK